MDTDWVEIYSTDVHYKAELLKGLLFENDILIEGYLGK